MKKMKKLFFILILAFGTGITANAQQHTDKAKKTSTVPQKVHNTFSRNKKYKGYKVKHKKGNVTQKHKVDLKKGEVKNKTTK
jgi:hypothetical protein